MSQAPNKNPLKDKLNDDELDLSISNYKDKDIPVKDIALLKRATKLDLSNNKLTGLPKSFASLTHLVKLDLSCNLITELPSNFGELQRLKHLDLYNNKLSHLPLSFHQLSSLRWLDLKNNPLSPQLAGAAGQCLNPRECEQCAKSVVTFMARVKDHYDQERVRREQHEKELMSAKLAAEEAEKERHRLEKKAKKEQKRLELQERRRVENLTAHPEQQTPQKTAALPVLNHCDAGKPSTRGRWSLLARVNVLMLLTALALAAGALYVHARGDVSRSGLRVAADSLAANLATLASLCRYQLGAVGDGALTVFTSVSHVGTSAGDVLVRQVVAGYEWGVERAASVDQYLTDNHGASWQSMKTTSASAVATAGEMGRAVGDRALVLGAVAARRGWELTSTWGAAAWQAAGPLWDAAAEHGTAVKAGVLAGAARLRAHAGPTLLEWAAVAQDAAAHALLVLQREAPGYASAAWDAACRAAAAAYHTAAALWTSVTAEAPSYASMAAEQFNRLVATVTGG